MSIPMIPTRSHAAGFTSPLPDERKPDTAELPLPLEELDWPEGALAWLQQLKPADPEPAGRQRLPTLPAPDNFAALAASPPTLSSPLQPAGAVHGLSPLPAPDNVAAQAASPLTLSSPLQPAGAVHGLSPRVAGRVGPGQAQVYGTATAIVGRLPEGAAVNRSVARHDAPSGSATAHSAVPMHTAQPRSVADATAAVSPQWYASGLTSPGSAAPGPTASVMASFSSAPAGEASAWLDAQVIPTPVLPALATAQRTPAGHASAHADMPRPNQGLRMPTLPATPAASGSAPYLQVSFDNGVESGSISVFQPPTGPTSLQPAVLQLQPSNPELRAYLHEHLVPAQQPWQLGDESGRGQQRQSVPGDDDQDDAQQQSPRHQDDEEQSA